MKDLYCGNYVIVLLKMGFGEITGHSAVLLLWVFLAEPELPHCLRLIRFRRFLWHSLQKVPLG